MINAGFTFENSQTQTCVVVLESDAETNGTGWLIEVTRTSKVLSDLPEHLHLTWTENFEILSGTAFYCIDGEKKTARAGDKFVVLPNHFHVHPWNAGETPIVYRQRDVFDPPSSQAVQDVLGVLATRAGMASDGKDAMNGFSKTLQRAVALRTFTRYGGYAAHPSIPIQKLIAGTLGVVGEALGFKAIYPQYVNQRKEEGSKNLNMA